MHEISVSIIGDDLVQVWPCCEHCEHDEVENPYHTEPCWCQEGPAADE